MLRGRPVPTGVVTIACLLVLAGGAGAGISASAAVSITPALRGFSKPVLVTFAPGDAGALYVVEQGGRIFRVAKGRRTVFLDVRRLVTTGGVEQGLLGLAFHPEYATNRRFYVAYTSRDGRNVVAQLRATGTRASASPRRTLLSERDPYANHNGGNLVFGPDGGLYTTIGDGGSGGDPENRSQNPRSLFGKLLRIDPASGQVRIAALGLRNAWRFSFDRANGDLWIGDVGQNKIEEIDRLPRNRLGQLSNFGWDVLEGRSSFEQKPFGPGRRVAPVAQYAHDEGCSVTGGYVYRGTSVPEAVGRYFYGDYCSGLVWSMAAGGQPRREPFQVESLSSFGEDASGELYLVSLGGTIYRLSG